MKNIFNIILIVLFLHNISYSQNKSNVECGFFGTKTVEERNSIFPFSEAKKVLLISYLNPEAFVIKKGDSISFSNEGFSIKKEFIFQNDTLGFKLYDAIDIKKLQEKDINKLSNLMFNYDYKVINNKKPITLSYAKCYTPRKAILFLDEHEKVISVLEICFECDKYYLFPKSKDFKDVLGVECDDRLNYFNILFQNIGYENYKDNQSKIIFEIIDEFGKVTAVPGVSIIVNNIKIIDTDFDGLAMISIDDKVKKVELSYMGKPTFVKIIPNCDFIKVDLSKRKAFYYKDNKFIKSKKLIIQ